MENYQMMEFLITLSGFMFVILLTVAKVLSICRISNKGRSTLEIFLDISDIQIQQYTSKSEKFIMSLHAEDLNGEIDVDEEVENTRKISSSTFTKKKRFKNITMRQTIIIKMVLTTFVYMAFFAHAFIINKTVMNFEMKSRDYYTFTSEGNYHFYSGLSTIQQALLANHTLPTYLSKTYFQYYQQYFHSHYNTYALVDPFHDAFTKVYLNDVCHGVASTYGNTSIP